MNRKVFLVQIVMILAVSQLAACGPLSFASAAPIEISGSTTLPVVNDAPPTHPPLELAWELRGGAHPFDVPVGVAADLGGKIYVMDTGNSRVQKFDSQGNFLQVWGGEGSGEGQFGEILSAHEGRLAADAQGNVYVIDLKNVRIQKFDGDGNYLTQWGTRGNGEDQFTKPFDIAVDQHNHIYVTDIGSNTVQKFDETGHFLLRWGRTGYHDGEFSDVYSVAIAPDGNVLVTDSTGRIQIFDSNGQFLSMMFLKPVANQAVFLWSIAVDTQGNIYAADWYGERIVKFDPEGKPLAAWRGAEAGVGWFANMQEIAVDAQGNIYLTDGTEDLVRSFRQTALPPEAQNDASILTGLCLNPLRANAACT